MTKEWKTQDMSWPVWGLDISQSGVKTHREAMEGMQQGGMPGWGLLIHPVRQEVLGYP
jgi:hypothetical protein